MSALVDDLIRPAAYPVPPPGEVELRETHASWVFLAGSEVYKVKKPIVFPFLDFGTVEARRKACEAEVVLNQRLAPGTYLGVVPVRRDGSGRLHFRNGGEIVDWAVHMTRLPDSFRADERLATGRLSHEHIDALAEHLAAFHQRVRTGPGVAVWGTPSAIERNVVDNFHETEGALDRFLSPRERAELESYQLDFLAAHRRLFARRAVGGYVREGHGDLRLEHVYLGPGSEITILDCIEFSERLRVSDVCADIAFLSMDLAAHGRVDLAERLIARYARAANDYELYEVVDFYESYRAFVRAKIATILAAGTSGALAEHSEADARHHFRLALASHRRSLLSPIVIAVGGAIASGKSTVANVIADRLSAPVVDADRTRKALLAMAPTAHADTAAFEGPYHPGVTQRVYAEMLLHASIVLGSGRPVILDATFRTAEMRAVARELAREHGVPFLMVECAARPETCKARLAGRVRATSVSDARTEIFDAFVARMEPMTELPAEERLVLDTERPLPEILAALDAHLARWPEGLVA